MYNILAFPVIWVYLSKMRGCPFMFSKTHKHNQHSCIYQSFWFFRNCIFPQHPQTICTHWMTLVYIFRLLSRWQLRNQAVGSKWALSFILFMTCFASQYVFQLCACLSKKLLYYTTFVEYIFISCMLTPENGQSQKI